MVPLARRSVVTVLISQVTLCRVWLVRVWVTSVLLCNLPPRPTQPGHPYWMGVMSTGVGCEREDRCDDAVTVYPRQSELYAASLAWHSLSLPYYLSLSLFVLTAIFQVNLG